MWWRIFLFFLLEKYYERKVHNILFLRLDLKHKHMWSYYFFCIGYEQGVAIVVEYDNASLFLMLLKSYHHLHPLSKVESSFANIREKYYSLDIFEMIININE